MKAISLWEFWATAIAIGAKKHETRGWATSYRGPLAIHAAKTDAHIGALFSPVTLDEIIVAEAFTAAGIINRSGLSFGCVVATCQLVGCYRVEQVRDAITPLERALGNYDDGRFAWACEDVVRLPKPIPARGFQQIWEWDNGEPAAPSPQGTLL